jgi:hypothetical protein
MRRLALAIAALTPPGTAGPKAKPTLRRAPARSGKKNPTQHLPRSFRVEEIVRTLKRATAKFPQPMGTAMISEKRTLFQLLVSTVCPAQTKDTTT